jgi:AraC family transcriptional regulator of adaptative response/methylated-DNA-[protein]-cysteine methyltransferase
MINRPTKKPAKSLLRRDAPLLIDCHAFDSGLGVVTMAQSPQGVCAIVLSDDRQTGLQDLSERLHRRFGALELVSSEAPDAGVMALQSFMKRPGPNWPVLPLAPGGTEFQRRVWRVLQDIPAGSVRTYLQIAFELGCPTASRAVAGACAANPCALLIPCHRVVGSDGKISGYRWGVERKRALLTWESQFQRDADRMSGVASAPNASLST